MKKPESIIKAAFGKLSLVSILGEELDLMEAVHIDPSGDLRRMLAEQPELHAIWGGVVSECERTWREGVDELEEMRGTRFTQYRQAQEEKEREEMAHHTFDEDEIRDQFKRRQRVKQMVAQGVRNTTTGRWRANFTDAWIGGMVESDPEVCDRKHKVRKLKAQYEMAKVMLAALDQRMRCLSHLAALDRDEHR